MSDGDEDGGASVENRRRVNVCVRGNVVRVDYRGVEILDHSETVGLNLLFRSSPPGATIRVNLAGVKFLPSGYFGALLDGVEMGFQLRLMNAESPIKALIGYQEFVTKGVVHL